jgi:hypothetical protein
MAGALVERPITLCSNLGDDVSDRGLFERLVRAKRSEEGFHDTLLLSVVAPETNVASVATVQLECDVDSDTVLPDSSIDTASQSCKCVPPLVPTRLVS